MSLIKNIFIWNFFPFLYLRVVVFYLWLKSFLADQSKKLSSQIAKIRTKNTLVGSNWKYFSSFFFLYFWPPSIYMFSPYRILTHAQKKLQNAYLSIPFRNHSKGNRSIVDTFGFNWKKKVETCIIENYFNFSPLFEKLSINCTKKCEGAFYINRSIPSKGKFENRKNN